MPDNTPKEAPAPPRRPWSRYFFLVGLAFFAFLVWHFGWRDLLETLLSARLGPLIWMTVLIFAGFWIRAWKWRYALGPRRNAVGLFFLSKMGGNWTPGRVGELAPLLLRRHRNIRVTAWILADRVIEVALTLLLGLLGVAVLALIPLPGIVALTGLALAGVLAFAALLWFAGRLGPHRGAQTQPTWRGRVLTVFLQLREELLLLGGKTPIIVLVTLIAKATDLYAVVLLCAAFGFHVSFLLACAARCAHAIVAAAPITPDATGVPFVAAAYVFHEYAGMPGETLTAAFALEVAVINLALCISFLAATPDLRERPEKSREDSM